MRRKFILLIFLAFFFLTGCTPIQDMSLDEIINNGTNRSVTVYNKYRKGYKYNLPKGLDVVDNTEYNEVIMSSDYTYYLYVDAVSYYNKIIETYEENNISYFSKAISFEDKYGYLEINELDNDKYFIEIMYNYAKIEVIVREVDINFTVLNSLNILSSITYNDKILDNLMGENVLQYKETEFNIFEPKDDSNYLYYKEKDEEQNNEEVHDSDLIN